MAQIYASGTRHTFTALQQAFVVDSAYQFVKELGQGAYGCVVAAKHRLTGEGCAIKKITNINTKVSSLLSHFHPRPTHAAHSSESSRNGVCARSGLLHNGRHLLSF